jgi:hypothetical protein
MESAKTLQSKNSPKDTSSIVVPVSALQSRPIVRVNDFPIHEVKLPENIAINQSACDAGEILYDSNSIGFSLFHPVFVDAL